MTEPDGRIYARCSSCLRPIFDHEDAEVYPTTGGGLDIRHSGCRGVQSRLSGADSFSGP